MPDPDALRIAFWLLPSDPDAKWLDDRIRVLARKHHGPEFDAHMTLHVANCPAHTDVEAVLERLARRHATLTLAAAHTDESAAYYQALFVRISSDLLDGALLTELRRQLVQELTPANRQQTMAAYAFLPHLSLLYGDLPQPLRQQLVKENDLQGRNIVFDRLAAVRPATGRVDLSRVEDWDIFGHRRLNG